MKKNILILLFLILLPVLVLGFSLGNEKTIIKPKTASPEVNTNVFAAPQTTTTLPLVNIYTHRQKYFIEIAGPSQNMLESEGYVHLLPIPRDNVIIEEEGNKLKLTQDNYFIIYTNSPGDPMLPGFIIYMLLPPETDLSTVQVGYAFRSYKEVAMANIIAPQPPDVSYDKSNNQITCWGENKNIIDGKNANVYDKDADYPQIPVRFNTGQKQDLKFVTIEVFPYQYNPKRDRLELSKKIELAINYQIGQSKIKTEINEAEMGSSKFILNNNRINDWYEKSRVLTVPGYAIITTNDVVQGSSKISDFVSHKQSKGFDVNLATETQWGVNGALPSPAQRAPKIREWLQNNYQNLNLQYVLLVGSPDPHDPGYPAGSTGEVPMIMCWPGSDPSLQTAPTDLYYAELTGDWDIDNDGYYCEYPDDTGPGGVETAVEVWVGRIPVYSNDYAKLDDTLQKIMDYENDQGNTSWRSKIILPMHFIDANTFGWELGEAISLWSNTRAMTKFRIYDEDFGVEPELVPTTYSNVKETWNGANDLFSGGVGVVTWLSHGYINYAENVMSTIYAPELNDNKPSFVFQASCSNGYPESDNNLASALIEKGAVTTVAASRDGWYQQCYGNTCNYYGLCEYAYHGTMRLACRYTKFLTQNNPGGIALDLMRQGIPLNSRSSYHNLFTFNLYGDPSTSLSLPQGNIAGTIRDNNGNYVDGSWIYFDGQKTVAYTNNGEFEIPHVSAGSRIISVKKLGYYPSENITIQVEEGQTTYVELVLPGLISPELIAPEDNSVLKVRPTLDWKSAEGAEAYQVRLVGGGINWHSKPLFVTQFKPVFSYKPGVEYEWKVRACWDPDCYSYNPWSEPFTFWWHYIPSGAPALNLPSNGSVVSNIPFALDWDNVEGAEKYKVKIKGGIPPGTIDATYATKATSYTVNGLIFDPGAEYKWKVAACWDSACSNQGPWSQTNSFWWQYSSCVPSLINPLNDSIIISGPVLSWSSCDGNNGYQLRVKGKGVNWLSSRIPDTCKDISYFIFQPGNSYTWKVRACRQWSGVTCTDPGDWSVANIFWWKHKSGQFLLTS
ncbi:hypothetical protein JW930_07420 [Candidatus Woesearchaeota archaeon]|nr:hypothetical protein [Candidatus Woesearchaeota archaeon]